MAELTYAELTQGRESTRLPHTNNLTSLKKNLFLSEKSRYQGPKCPVTQEGEQDSSPTRQFTDTVFEDSSPTKLKTVHRHFWREFADTFV